MQRIVYTRQQELPLGIDFAPDIVRRARPTGCSHSTLGGKAQRRVVPGPCAARLGLSEPGAKGC